MKSLPLSARSIPTLRQQAAVTNSWLKERLQTVLPEVMRREGIDLWIVTAREYNEDPVLLSLLPAPMMSARRRTILVFSAPADGEFEAMAIANAGVGLDGYYTLAWDKSQTALAAESQADCLRRVVAERDPQRIGIDFSDTFAFGDGLSHTEHAFLAEALGPELMARTVSAEKVAVGWLERRLPAEIAAAGSGNVIAHDLISEAFSSRVIQPGITTALDVSWWLRERTRELGLTCWFQPSVSIQRRGANIGPIGASPDVVIMPGDLLHCDFGLHFFGLATDTQQNAYVLRPGESSAPAGLSEALRTANRQQDILAEAMVAGRSGNEILAAALAGMRESGINGRIYTHPVGYHGHGAGPMIGRYDNQVSLPGTGDALLHDDTLFSFEMYCHCDVPEWDGQQIMLATEQIVAFTEGRIAFLGGRQEELHLV